MTEIVLTDGGIETALEERLGQRLAEFAAFPLLGTVSGREALRAYYTPFIELARDRGLPLVLDTPTWRANPDWGRLLGARAEELELANADAVALVRQTAEELWPEGEVTVNGCVGPRFDEYDAGQRMSEAEAEAYHAPQVKALAEAGADRVTSVTTLDAAEGIGVVRAAVSSGVPVAVSFVVGADGLLADGSTIAEGIDAVDEATNGAAVGFLVNCAHPSEVEAGIRAAGSAAGLARLIGFRLNAAREGDEGPVDDPAAFAEAELRLRDLLPGASALGGCCGTDTEHIAALADGAAARSADSRPA
ncbi:homocysteine S-methyltransferase family protein [Leucobacter luti]|uniref:homocysteine S-methyltransferase family protein n=1 Tax=Leucobacter luti TaxID=340320 RepID=UPI003CFD7A4B